MEEKQECLIFAVNGERFEVPNVDPSTTLLDFLRCHTHFKSVKPGCGDGVCGACVVLLSKLDPVSKQVEDYTVSSCLTLLCSVNGCSITTTEGLGNSKDGFHPIHQRFAAFHASQCGFCTPGFCMSLYSALVRAEKTPLPEPPPGFSRLTASEAEEAVSGNLCRCTGYRPIADACKSFASDVDIEDLGINSFWKNKDGKEEKIRKMPPFNHKDHISTYPEFLKDDHRTRLNSWYSPVFIEELENLLHHEDCTRIKLVVGNTGTGYYNETQEYDKYIDLRYIPEFSAIQSDNSGIEFGATVSISKVISYLKEENSVKLSPGGELVFKKVAEHMEKIASNFIRNTASIGGNLVMAQRNYFPSDISTLFLALSSSVSIMTGQKLEKITLEEFFWRPPLDPSTVLLTVHIPFWEPIKSADKNDFNHILFETFRAAPRPTGNALPYLNAAFFAKVSYQKDGVLVNKIQLAFGAYGVKHSIRARKVEQHLNGKVLSLGVLNEAIKLVKDCVIPEDGTSFAAYRSSLAVGFLFERLFSFTSLHYTVRSSKGLNEKILDELFESKNGRDTLLSSAKQIMESSEEYYPVGEPMVKFDAAIQASGEAVYVDDIPSPPNSLHGAFIYSTKPLARVKGISFKSNSLPKGVTAVISYKDIPKGGENVGGKTLSNFDPLFADEFTRYAGDRIALLIAETRKSADEAAKLALVEYDTEGLDPPILTVQEAVERSSFIEVPPGMHPAEVGDFQKGMAEADHSILSAEIKLGSQYYFYMETQTALAIPDEDNCMLVYSSSQRPESAHSVIARCLGIPENNIRVITRRVGGGFGGKGTKSIPVATACALAAHCLRRPVRVYLDRKTDMIMAGGRHPMEITYTVGFKSNGKITALHLDVLINAGNTIDASTIIPRNTVGALKRYNWGALSFDIKLCKTNHCGKTAMRAPGEVQGSFVAESILQNVASVLSLDVDSVRNKNFHTYESLKLFYGNAAGDSMEYTLPTIWDKLGRSSSFEQRIKMIEHFNSCNIWRKRGISRVPVVYQVYVRPTPGRVSILWDGSIVVEVGGIEIGQGLWTKVRQVTAYALSAIQCGGTEDLVEKVRVVQADTLSLVQGGITAGSTTSEASCEAVRLCCNVLVERLVPLKKKLQEQGSVNWDSLILEAENNSVNLAASSYYVPVSDSGSYLNYGAAVSEVEVNVLTGETTILRADIVYDCGKSLNPAVDLGQIEGSFIQGVGFFMLEEYLTNADGLVVTDNTWTYKIPTIDTIPKQFNVEVLNSGHHQKRVLSSKASGEPPILLAVSVHCATRAAIEEARKQRKSWGATLDDTDLTFQLEVPAIMPVVKQLCGLDTVEWYLQNLLAR